MGNTDQNQQSRQGSVFKTLLVAFLIILLGMIIVVVAFVTGALNKIKRADPNETFVSPEQAATMDLGDGDNHQSDDTPDITWPEDTEELIGEDDNITNILLIGQDRRPGEGRARSDAMILVSVNKEKKSITMVSFLRDNYVQIPDGYMDNRLNAAYAFGGMKLLDWTLEQNFGIYIDHNLEVDFEAFTKVIDLIGGVDVDMTQEEVEYMDPKGKLGLVEGINHLDGEQALSYSRIRYLDSDFGRTNRQRKVLGAMADEAKNMSLMEAMSLASEIFPWMTTDMTNSDMIAYVTEFLPILTGGTEIKSLRIPGDDDYYYATIRGMSVLVPDLDSSRQILAEALK